MLHLNTEKQAFIYLVENEKPVVQLPVDETILDIGFSKDGKKLAYVVTDKEMSSESESAVHLIQTGYILMNKFVFRESALITELAFDPKDSDSFCFIYKRIRLRIIRQLHRAHPHDFDVHSIHLRDNAQTKHTDLKKYNMQSLQVSSTEESVYVQMDDDEHVQIRGRCLHPSSVFSKFHLQCAR